MRTRALYVLGLLLVMVTATTLLALAHANYERSEPAKDATVNQIPTQVRIWFTEDLATVGNVMKVVNEAGQQVDNGDTKVEAANRRLMTATLKPNLPNGKYTVQWKNNATDGHEESGEFSFTLSVAAQPAAPVAQPTAVPTLQPAPVAQPTAAPAPRPTMPTALPTTGASLQMLAGSLILLGAGLTALGLGRRRAS